MSHFFKLFALGSFLGAIYRGAYHPGEILTEYQFSWCICAALLSIAFREDSK